MLVEYVQKDDVIIMSKVIGGVWTTICLVEGDGIVEYAPSRCLGPQ